MKNRQVYLSEKHGFTLIEVVLVIGLAMIMLYAAVYYNGGAKNDKAVETAARDVASALREAQNYALTGKGAISGCDSGNSRYSFSYGTPTTSDYKIGGCMNPELNYKLSNGVIFSGASDTIYFSMPNAITSGAKTITVNKGTLYYYVCLCPSGKITESATGCPAC